MSQSPSRAERRRNRQSGGSPPAPPAPTPSGFNDHPTVVVLEFMLLRLIAKQCRGAADPAAALAEWVTALADQEGEAGAYALLADTGELASRNALDAAGAYKEMAEQLRQAVEAPPDVRH